MKWGWLAIFSSSNSSVSIGCCIPGIQEARKIAVSVIKRGVLGDAVSIWFRKVWKISTKTWKSALSLAVRYYTWYDRWVGGGGLYNRTTVVVVRI